MSGVESSFSAAAVAAAATERALERLLRGATWQAITREIAWRAVAEAGGDHDLVRNLGCVADESLSELIDGIECRVDAAAVRAWRGHLRWRPHDHAGAELAAAIEAREEAQQLVVAAYAQVCRDIEGAARARRAAVATAPRRRRLLRRHREGKSPPLPSVDLGELVRARERYGWPRRDAA